MVQWILINGGCPAICRVIHSARIGIGATSRSGSCANGVEINGVDFDFDVQVASPEQEIIEVADIPLDAGLHVVGVQFLGATATKNALTRVNATIKRPKLARRLARSQWT